MEGVPKKILGRPTLRQSRSKCTYPTLSTGKHVQASHNYQE